MKSATWRPAALVVCSLLFLAISGAPAGAQDAPTPESPIEAHDPGPFAVGFQSSWPAYGISGIYNVTDKIGAQLVVGAFGSWTTLTGRGLYRFAPGEKYSPYGFGTAGVYRYSYGSIGTASESSVIVGAGGGVEVSLPALFEDSDFPPLFWSVDLGFSAGSFQFYNWSGFSWGSGLHYRF